MIKGKSRNLFPLDVTGGLGKPEDSVSALNVSLDASEKESRLSHVRNRKDCVQGLIPVAEGLDQQGIARVGAKYRSECHGNFFLHSHIILDDDSGSFRSSDKSQVANAFRGAVKILNDFNLAGQQDVE